MRAICKVCRRDFIVPKSADPDNYVCPDCEEQKTAAARRAAMAAEKKLTCTGCGLPVPVSKANMVSGRPFCRVCLRIEEDKEKSAAALRENVRARAEKYRLSRALRRGGRKKK